MAQQLLSVDGHGVSYWLNSATPDKENTTGHEVSVFLNGVSHLITISGVMPVEYSGGDFEVYLHWASWTATTGVCRWQVEWERLAEDGNPTNALNFGTGLTVDSTVPASLSDLRYARIPFTVAQAENVAAGESFRLRVTRLGAHANDSLLGASILYKVVVNEQ